MNKKTKRRIKIFTLYFFYFIVFSFVGSLIEHLSILIGGEGIDYDKLIYQWFNVKIYFISFYGVGALLMIFLGQLMDRKKVKFLYRGFFNSLIIVIWEFIGGLFCLFVLGERLWDYSREPFNFMGIVSLQIFLIWLVLGYIFSIIYRYGIRFLNRFLL
ncbi:Putative ABC-transporter type IV [uncultured archaeon]|nr:Putative ABC-transporter type IV [uncultured archaeon]